MFPDGKTAQDVTPVVQVINNAKGTTIKWTLPSKHLQLQSSVSVYELYTHIVKKTDKEDVPPISEWDRVGKVKPMKLPMAVILKNVTKTKKYLFSVRALFGEGDSCASQFSKPIASGLKDNALSCKFVGI